MNRPTEGPVSARMPLHQRLLIATAFLLVAGVGWLFITADLSLYWQMLLGVMSVLAALLLKRAPGGWGPSYALMAISTLTTSRYIYWRITETLPIGRGFDVFDLAFAVGLLLAEIYAWAILVLGFFQVLQPLQRKPVPLPEDPAQWPVVDVFIPTYNESLDVVRPTVVAALDLDWPRDKLRVYVLDDGRRSDFAAFCEKVGAIHLTRDDNRHAKAGNINAALKQTSAEYVAIFDADHIPTRSFLQMTMGALVADPGLAMVQTPHHFFSADPFERNLEVFRESPNEGELFYGLLQDGNDYWNATFFCGSCAVLNRAALEEIGGVAVETVTEDAHTSLKMHRRGWRTAYINIPQAAGLATESLSAHVGQRIRWARGMAQIFRLDNPFFGRGLGIGQRLCYGTAMLHFFYGFPRLVFLTAPLAFLLLDARIIAAQGLMIISFALPHLLCAILTNSRLQGRFRHSFFAEVYETVLAVFIIIPTTLAIIRPHSGAFNVTAKGGIVDRDYFDKDLAKPYLWLFLINTFGVIFGVVRLLFFDPDVDTLYITMGWTVFNLVLIGAALRVASEKRQIRHTVRVACQVPASIQRERDGATLETTTLNLSYGGAAVHLPDNHDLQEGDRIWVALIPEFAEVWTPATVRRLDNGLAALSFEPLDLEQERQLVYAIYGRADAWLRWRNNARPDKPLQAFRSVLHFGYEGLFIFLTWMWTSMLAPFRRTSRAAGAIVLSVALAGLMQAAPAPAQEDIPVTRLDDTERVLSLSDLGTESTIRMRNIAAARSLPVNVRDDQVVTNAKLTLDYRYSPALRPDISQLRLLLNGEVVDTWLLDSETPAENRREIAIDPKLFGRYNDLQLASVASYARDECEDPTHPSLWIDIDGDSHLDLELAPLALQPDLTRLPAPFFDEADTRRLRLPFVLPANADHATIRAAVTLSSWFGGLADWRGAEFPVRATLADDMHSVALRTSARDIPAFEHIPLSDEPEIRILPHPDQRALRVLLISAPDVRGLQRAAEALAFGASSMLGERARIRNFERPAALPEHEAPRWLSPEDPARIAEMAREGLSVQGLGTRGLRFDFRLAPHLYMHESGAMELALTARAGAAAAEGSMMGLRFNDQFVNDVRLYDDGSRGFQQSLRMKLPAMAARYSNRITLDFDILRSQREYCEVFEPQLLRASVDEDIRLELPRHAYYARLPELALFANGGFPFSRFADGAGMAFVLPDSPNNEDIAATLTVAGFLGATTGAVLNRAGVLPERAVGADTTLDLLYVGGAERLQAASDEQLGLPLHFDENDVTLRDIGTLAQLSGRMRGTDYLEAHSYAARVVHDAGNRLGAIMAAESTFTDGASVLVVTAGNNGSVLDTARLLLEAGTRQFIRGGLTLSDREEVSGYTLGPDYAVGSLPWDWALQRWIAERPWMVFILLPLAALIAVWALRAALRNRAQRRLKGDA